MSKQDRQGARTPAQLEQRYDFSELSKGKETNSRLALQVSQLTQTLAQFMASTNANIEALTQVTGGLSNALVGEATGTVVRLEDVSTIEHTLIVKLSGGDVESFDKVKLVRYGASDTESPQTYEPNKDGTVEGVTSLYPITTLSTDTEGVVIEVKYNRDLNKAFAELEGG